MDVTMDIDLSSVKDQLKKATEQTIAKILEEWGLTAEKYAKNNIRKAGRVRSGVLRNSIEHSYNLGNNTVVIGTNIHYAVYNEVGTGVYFPGGRKTPWMWVDENGHKHWTEGMEGIHFLRNALLEHADVYQRIAIMELKELE